MTIIPSPKMIREGVLRLRDLEEADVSSAYIVTEIYLAMHSVRLARGGLDAVPERVRRADD